VAYDDSKQVEIIRKNQARKLCLQIPTTNQQQNNTTQHLLGVNNGTWWHHDI
jgi:hypothetical protein